MPTTQPSAPIRLYRHPISGHCHRVELFLSLLGLDHELVLVDLKQGAHKQAGFLEKNPFGQVPVIEDGAHTLADSNAILIYLAATYGEPHWLPADPAARAAIQRWLSVAAGQIAFGPARARLINLFGLPSDPAPVIERAHAILALMDQQLADGGFLTGAHPTIADIACYTYVAHAPEGNVSLKAFTGVNRWLRAIEALPGFVPMASLPIGLNA